MSKLSQSKREAKRLLKLAQETNNQLAIPNLSTAQKVIAYTNGFKNWHDFEVNLNKEEVNKENQGIYHYLANETIYNLKSLYVDEKIFNPSEYDGSYSYELVDNENKDNKMKNIGSIKEKGIFSEKRREINYCKRNHLIVGQAGSGKSELVKNIMEDCSSSSCIYFSNYEGINLYQRLNMSKKEMIKDIYYCSLLKDNKTFHSIDLINNLIDLEVGFKKSFNIKNDLLADIFYKLAQYYRSLNKALDSKDLKLFLSLSWLSKFNENSSIKILINNYFQLLKIDLENILEDNFFNNFSKEIQEHHQNCYFTQNILKEMEEYEEKGVFSKTPQITFNDLLKKNKHLIFDIDKGYKNNQDESYKNLLFFIYSNYFYSLKNRNDFLTYNIIEDYEISLCYSAVTVIEDVDMLLNNMNKNLFNVFNEILQSFKSPFFMTLQILEKWKSEYHQLLNHINFYIFMRSEINDLIPEICKKMMMTGLENFTNIKNKRIDISSLDVGECYYWTNTHMIFDSKNYKLYHKNSNYDLLLVRINYHYGKYNKNIDFINHQVLKKVKQ